MISVLDKYFAMKKKELIDYSSNILSLYKTSVINDKKLTDIKKIISIYIDEYYCVNNIEFYYVNKYYNFNNDSMVTYKTILDATIRYFVSLGYKISDNNNYITYLSYVIYSSAIISKIKTNIIDQPSQTTFTKNILKSICKNLNVIEYDEEDNKSVSKITRSVKAYLKKQVTLENGINGLVNKDSFNNYIQVSYASNLFKIKYNSKIYGLEDYKERDIAKIVEKENFDEVLLINSYELGILTILKSLLKNKNIKLILEINNEQFKKKSVISSIIKLTKSKYLKEHISLLINIKDYVENDSINKLINHGLKIYVVSDRWESIKNINFSKFINLLTTSEFVTKYKEELKNYDIEYIVKEREVEFSESEILNRKEVKEEEQL